MAVETEVQPASAPPASIEERSAVLRWIVKSRWAFFLWVALLLLLSYNGQWRIGRDSSLYRDVARNLAGGRGYKFRGQVEQQIYPGLPYLLAGVERAFGPQDALRPRASLLIMLGMAAVTLIAVYHMVRAYFPQWVAVCVTTGVGTNKIFLEHANELMSDMPFLMGVCLFLLGVAWMTRQATTWRKAASLLLAIAGAGIALSMRPTFWALAAAWVGTCLVGMIRSPRRRWYIAGLASLAVLAVLWAKFDPRPNDRYLEAAWSHLRALGDTPWPDRIVRTFEVHLPEALFGFELFPPLGTLLALSLIAAAIFMMRQSVLWGMYLIITIVMTLLLGNVARYYLMVLPLLLVAWAAVVGFCARAGRRWRFGVDAILLCGLGIATLIHVGQSVGLILEQHGLTRTLARKTFLEVYRGGKMQPLVRLSNALRDNVPPDARVIGIEPRITTFLSGRSVYQLGEPAILGKCHGPEQWPAQLQKLRARYLVWSPQILKEETLLRRVLAHRILQVRFTKVRIDGGMRLMAVNGLRPRPPAQPASRPAATAPAAPKASRPPLPKRTGSG